MKRLSLMAAVAAVALASPAFAETVAITSARVVAGDGSGPVEGGTVVVADGRIVAAGQGVTVPAGARVIDAEGRFVTPGIVAGFTRLGLAEVDAVEQTNDTRANSGPFSAAIDITPAINPNVEAIGVNRRMGVTRAVVAPVAARSIFAGQGAVIDLGADANPITRARAFQLVEFGEQGASEAGGSRASTFVLFANALREARDLLRGRPAQGISSQGRGEPRRAGVADQRDLPLEDLPSQNPFIDTPTQRAQDVLLTRFDAAALVPVLQGRQALMVHVESASDILNVLSLRREFPQLRLILLGASEGWRVAREIAAAGVPVIASPLNDLPSAFEKLAATQSNVGRMTAAGVRVAVGTPEDDETRMAFRSMQYAGNLVGLTRVPGATGLSYGEAMAAITSRPAEALGLGGEIGSLRPGRRADVVIWDGDPLDSRSAPVMVMIDGVEQSLVTRQTRLRDRYRDLQRESLPFQYRP